MKSSNAPVAKPIVLITGAAGNIGSRLVHELGTDYDIVGLGMPGKEAPCEPGELINEESDLAPGWAYPESTLCTEKIIAASHRRIPCLLRRLAGLYDDSTAVSTLSHHIARIHERNVKSRLYSGDPATGQAFIHVDDLVDLFKQAVWQRAELPEGCVILAGEGDVMSCQALQDAIGSCLHGEEEWASLSIPPSQAPAGDWLEVHLLNMLDFMPPQSRPRVRHVHRHVVRAAHGSSARMPGGSAGESCSRSVG